MSAVMCSSGMSAQRMNSKGGRLVYMVPSGICYVKRNPVTYGMFKDAQN